MPAYASGQNLQVNSDFLIFMPVQIAEIRIIVEVLVLFPAVVQPKQSNAYSTNPDLPATPIRSLPTRRL